MAGMFSRILILALAAASVLLAADPTGTWVGDQPGLEGKTYTITFKLKADGGKLTGTMTGDQFEEIIKSGEIHGDEISFTVRLDLNDTLTLKYVGKVAADKIEFEAQQLGAKETQTFVVKKS
jgi:hypothetical protein